MISNIHNIYKKFLNKKENNKTLLIGIDGGGGAGKSTFAERIREVDPYNVTVVHMDDFYKTSIQRLVTDIEIGGLWDCARIKRQVLAPLKNEQNTKYQIYDWDLDELTEWKYIYPGGVVIVEGCYSLIQELKNYYDVKIWIDTPPEQRLLRGIKRDGNEKRYLWENVWMPAEEFYMNTQQPMMDVDMVIDGSKEKVINGNFMVNIIKTIAMTAFF